MAWQSDHNARDTENLVNAKAESFAQLICLRSVQAEKILRRVMLRRFADAGGRLQRACQGYTFDPLLNPDGYEAIRKAFSRNCIDILFR